MKPSNKNSRVKPVVAQLKTPASAQNLTRRVAPPVYRPQPIPKVLQKKTSPVSGNPRAEAIRRPLAPAVYRPQPIPRVLQTKTAPGVGNTRAETPRQSFTSAVHSSAVQRPVPPGNFVVRRFSVAQCSFQAGSFDYPVAKPAHFSAAAVEAAIAPLDGEAGRVGRDAGRKADSGVEVGDAGSYAVIQWLEKVGDGLTGDHEPSGAAIKEAIREQLHTHKLGPLTRQMARNAYARAVTVVVTDAWHKAFSRTYGGRNTSAQILMDAANLAKAAMADWQKLAPELEAEGWTQADLMSVWNSLDNMRQEFYTKGVMTLELVS